MAAGKAPNNIYGNTSWVTYTFPSGRFTQAPMVSAIVDGYHGAVAHADSVSSSSFRLHVLSMGGIGTSNSVGVWWTAVQMTSNSGAG
jgi:hypothetical protein